MKYRIVKYMTGYAIQKRVFLFWWEFVRDDEAYGSMMVEGNPPLFFPTENSAKLGVLSLRDHPPQY